MNAPEEPGTWILLSKATARVRESHLEAKQDALMERIAARQYRVRFSNSNELNTHRDGNRLHADFFRLGVVNWLFSAVTFNGRTIHQIEIFVPDEVAAADVGAPAVELYRTGCPGQPTAKYLMLPAAELKLSNGWLGTTLEPTLKKFASEMLEWLATEHPKAPQPGESAVRNFLREVFNRYKRNA
jgi:hypothetical protein